MQHKGHGVSKDQPLLLSFKAIQSQVVLKL